MKTISLITLLSMALLTGCAVTYPIKDGSVTLSFTPPPELLNKYGINYEFPKPKGTK
jgi:hypothetical protein